MSPGGGPLIPPRTCPRRNRPWLVPGCPRSGRGPRRCAWQPGNPRGSPRGSPQRAGSFGARAARTARRLGRDSGATLATACSQHGTPCPGAHPGPEPVRAGAPTVVRLERALHGVILAAGCSRAKSLRPCAPPAGRTSSWVLRYATAAGRVKRARIAASSAPGTAPGSPPCSWGPHGTAGCPDHPVVGTPGNLWKTLARRRWAGIGSPGCPGWVSQDLGHARGKRDIRG